jgi:hypothetical protein
MYRVTEQQSKLLPRGRRAIFVGYDDNASFYRLYDPLLRRIIQSRDVTFLNLSLSLLKARTPLHQSSLLLQPMSVRHRRYRKPKYRHRYRSWHRSSEGRKMMRKKKRIMTGQMSFRKKKQDDSESHPPTPEIGTTSRKMRLQLDSRNDQSKSSRCRIQQSDTPLGMRSQIKLHKPTLLDAKSPLASCLLFFWLPLKHNPSL